jgi:hypothetical protein
MALLDYLRSEIVEHYADGAFSRRGEPRLAAAVPFYGPGPAGADFHGLTVRRASWRR